MKGLPETETPQETGAMIEQLLIRCDDVHVVDLAAHVALQNGMLPPRFE